MPHKQLQLHTRARRPCHTSNCKCKRGGGPPRHTSNCKCKRGRGRPRHINNCTGWDLLFASYSSRKNQMQIPRFGLIASLGMTKQVGESRFEDCSLRERSFRSVEW